MQTTRFGLQILVTRGSAVALTPFLSFQHQQASLSCLQYLLSDYFFVPGYLPQSL